MQFAKAAYRFLAGSKLAPTETRTHKKRGEYKFMHSNKKGGILL